MDSYSEVYIMFVWGVKYRLGLIDRHWAHRLYAVLGNLAKEINCIPVAIGGMPDHVHVLLSLGNDAPSCKDIVRQLKSKSSHWVNANRLTTGKFAWQEGSGRFSYIKRDLPKLINYIQNQETHHCDFSFRDETQWLLDRLHTKYNPNYLPAEPE